MRVNDGTLVPHPHDYLIGEMLEDRELRMAFISRTRRGKWACIEWIGARNRGYGSIGYRGHTMVASRVAWILRNRQPIPLYMQIDHLCVNPGCVNPDHLEVVTAEVNYDRRFRAPQGWVSVGNSRYPRRRKLKGTKANTPPNPMFPTVDWSAIA